MAIARFYHPHPLGVGEVVSLSDNASAHATRALRLQVGDRIGLFNGDGQDYQCVLRSISKTATSVQVESASSANKESPLHITLLQGISSGTRMDYTIQKATELGVTCIQPLATERSVVKLSAERAEMRLHRQHPRPYPVALSIEVREVKRWRHLRHRPPFRSLPQYE